MAESMSITRKAGNISDQGIAGMGELVKKRRLANVGAAHQGDGRQQGYLVETL